MGVILGGLVGYLWPDISGWAAFLYVGELFLGGLRLLVIPLVVASVVTGLAALRNTQKAGKALALTLGYFIGTTLLATILGILVVSIMSPGFALAGYQGVVDSQIHSMQTANSANMIGVALQSLFPTDWGTAARGQYLGIIILSMIFGMVLATMGSRQRSVADTFRGINEALLRLFRLVIWATPVGLFFVTASTMSSGTESLANIAELGYFLIAFTVGLALHIFVILPLILHFFGGKNVFEYYHNLLPAISGALSSGSSAATLPITYSCVVDRNAISHRAASMALPMGSCLNFDGAAMFSVMAVIFAAQAAEFSLSFGNYLFILVAALGISFLTAGMPIMAMVGAVLTATAIGLPDRGLAVLGLLLPLQWLTVRGSALMSILSDSIGAAVIAKQLGERIDTRRSREDYSQSRGRDDRRSYSRDNRDSRDSRDRRSARDSRTDRDPRSRRDDGNRDDRRSSRGRSGDFDRRSRDRQSEREERSGRPQKMDESRDRTDRPGRRPQERSGQSPFAIRAESAARQPELESPAAPMTTVDTEKESTPKNEKQDSPAAPIHYGRKRSHHGRVGKPEQQENPKDEGKSKESSPEPRSKSGRSNPGRRAETKPIAAESPKPSKEDKDVEPDDIANRTVQRERAKVAAQLAAMKQAEELSRAALKAAERVTAKIEQREQEAAEEKAEIEAISSRAVQIDYVSDENPEKPTTELVSESVTETTETEREKPESKLPKQPTAEESENEIKAEKAEEPDRSAQEPVTEAKIDEEPRSASDEEVDTEDDDEPDIQYGRPRRNRGNIRNGEETSDDNDNGETNVAVMDEPKPLDDFSNENMSFGRTRKKRTR
ncbi:MAG TPA: cation:dicarboxylase symporter family transporter [candidate division Zixibacteria bacterium]|nr:cation:dicarboxylase symporter family transporter [candidate division Zixibacteria bacterium]